MLGDSALPMFTVTDVLTLNLFVINININPGSFDGSVKSFKYSY